MGRVGMAVWQCRVLLVVVLLHLALSSPAVRRDLRGLTHDPPQDPLALAQPESLGEDVFGGAADSRGGREKRLLKTIGVVKGVKAVATKAAVTGAKAIGAKLLKSSAGVAAGALGLKTVAAKTVGAKVKAVGIKAVTTVAALGIKALLIKLLFGNINKIITQKEKLLNQLDAFNKVQNQKFSQQMFGHAPCKYPQGAPEGYPQGAPGGYPAPTVAPAPLPLSPLPLPELTKSSLQSSSQPRQRPAATPAPGSDDEIPQFDPNKISLQVPDELFAPAFNSVNSISTVLGNLIQNTAERVARLVERMKPLLRSSLGFQSRKRETQKDKDSDTDDLPDTNDLSDNETTFFTDSDALGNEVQEIAGSETQTQTTATTDEENIHSPIKSSYAALSGNR